MASDLFDFADFFISWVFWAVPKDDEPLSWPSCDGFEVRPGSMDFSFWRRGFWHLFLFRDFLSMGVSFFWWSRFLNCKIKKISFQIPYIYKLELLNLLDRIFLFHSFSESWRLYKLVYLSFFPEKENYLYFLWLIENINFIHV